MVRNDICVAIADQNLESIKRILSEVALAEIRIDMLNLMPEELNEVFSEHNNLIATCRPGRFDDNERAIILERALMHGAAYIDLEIDTPQVWREPLIKLATELDRKVIVSYHNFDTTPSDDELDRIISTLWEAGADIPKLACMANTNEESARILNLYAKHKGIVALGMGKHGAVTRVAATPLGSPFTFASVNGKSTAPGQIDYLTLENILNSIESK